MLISSHVKPLFDADRRRRGINELNESATRITGRFWVADPPWPAVHSRPPGFVVRRTVATLPLLSLPCTNSTSGRAIIQSTRPLRLLPSRRSGGLNSAYAYIGFEDGDSQWRHDSVSQTTEHAAQIAIYCDIITSNYLVGLLERRAIRRLMLCTYRKIIGITG